MRGAQIVIHGDGETTRDFCFVENVIQANLLAATAPANAAGEVYNVAVGGSVSLNALAQMLHDLVVERHPELQVKPVVYSDFRPGDIRHSQADIQKAHRLLGFEPTHDVPEGLRLSMDWYERNLGDTGRAHPDYAHLA